jgi:hypothetical protein
MLEIPPLRALGKKIADNAGDKGYGPVGFVVLLVGLWFGGELFGAMLGVLLTGEVVVGYLFALFGAVVGAVTAFVIVALLPSERDEDEYFLYRHRVRRGRRARRRPSPREEEDEERPRRRRAEPEEDYEVVEEDEPRPRPRPAKSEEDYEVVEDEEPRPRRRRYEEEEVRRQQIRPPRRGDGSIYRKERE